MENLLGNAPRRRNRQRRKPKASSGNKAYHAQIYRAPRFGRMPVQFQVALPYRQSAEPTLASGINRAYAIGLFDYLNQLPLYAAQLYQMYRYSRIDRVDIKLEVNAIPGGTAYGYDVAIGKVPYSEYSSTMSPDIVAVTTGAVWGKGGLYGGKPVILSKSFESQNIFGQVAYGEEVWQTYTQATSATPTNTNKPVICVAIGATPSTGTLNCSLSWQVIYHIEFFDLDSTPESAPGNALDSSFEAQEMVTPARSTVGRQRDEMPHSFKRTK